MDRDFIGVGDHGINQTLSEHDSISFSKTPSRRSLLFRRFLSIFGYKVLQMTPAVPRCSMQTTSSEQDYETASEEMSDTDSGDNNPIHSPPRTREDLLRFQNLSTDQVGPIPDTGVNASQAFASPAFENPSPTIESAFPPQNSAKRKQRRQNPLNRFNRFTDHVSAVPDTKMPPAIPVRSFAGVSDDLEYDTVSKTPFTETNWERDFVSSHPAGYPRIIPAPYSGDQNSYSSSPESIEDTFPAQNSNSKRPYSSHDPREQKKAITRY